MDTHGKPRIDVKLERYELQKGIIAQGFPYPPWCGPKSKNTKFAAWARRVEARAPDVWVTPRKSHAAPYNEGEMAYRKKQVIKRAAARPRALPSGLTHVEKIARKLHTDGPGVTTSSQVEAIRTWAWSTYQSGRKLLGMKPTLRQATTRTRYELMDAINHDSEAKATKTKVVAVVDTTTPMTELVRRYRRLGIGY